MDKVKYRIGTCSVCLKEFKILRSAKGYKASHCQQKYGLKGDSCWFSKGSLQKNIAETLIKHRPRRAKLAKLRERLLRELFNCIEQSELAVDSYLSSLDDNERAYLLKYTDGSLHLWIQEKFLTLELDSQFNLLSVTYPDLPDALLHLLKKWEETNRRRLQRRIKHGFSRSPKALTRLLSEPIRLALILQSNGKTDWSQMTLADQLTFAKENNTNAVVKLKPFIKFLEGKVAFSGGIAMPEMKKNFSVLNETHAVDYLTPEQLDKRIKQARETLSKEEFLIFWLVAKMGLSLTRVYSITPRQITVNSKGRLIFKPANTWSPLPEKLSETLKTLTQSADTNWPYSNPMDALPIAVMETVAPYSAAHMAIFDNDVRLLRTSALMLLMHKGMLDRKTLSNLTGASWPTLRTLEFQLSSDIHSFASHDFIRARNKAILGDDDEQ